MSYTIITSPNKYSNGYSAIPFRISDTQASSLGNYKYIVNILHNKKTVSSSSSYSIGNYTYCRLNFSTAHKFKLGENLFLNDVSDFYDGYYTVMEIISSTSIVIDLNYQNPLNASVVASVIPFKDSPSPDGDLKLDLGDVIKNEVTQNLSDLSDCFAGDDTRFDYDIVCGREFIPTFEFTDNYFSINGAVGFVNPSLTSPSQVDFQIGDEISITQDLYSWNYLNNFYNWGSLGITGNTAHGFAIGDTVNITGQITVPSYNGSSTVISASTYSIVLNKPFTSSTPVEGGTAYGVVTPQYNRSTIVTDIRYVSGVGVVVTTDIGWTEVSPVIGGIIKPSDGRLKTKFDGPTLSNYSAFNSFVNKLDYTISDADKYVLSAGTHYFSTILKTAQGQPTNFGYRIEESTKSWLLTHNSTSGFSEGTMYVFSNSSNETIAISYLPNISSNKFDYYSPIGINQLKSSSNRVDITGGTLVSLTATTEGQIDSYIVSAWNLTNDEPVCQPFKFILNDMCSRYEIYHLMWKDSRGSWLSFPFKFLSQDSTEVDKKTYYRNEGNWNFNSFGYEDFDRGETTYFSRSRDKILLNSGWIDEDENKLIKDLFKSASVYIQTPENKLIGATILEKDIKFGKNINDDIFQYTINLSYSSDENRY